MPALSRNNQKYSRKIGNIYNKLSESTQRNCTKQPYRSNSDTAAFYDFLPAPLRGLNKLNYLHLLTMGVDNRAGRRLAGGFPVGTAGLLKSLCVLILHSSDPRSD